MTSSTSSCVIFDIAPAVLTFGSPSGDLYVTSCLQGSCDFLCSVVHLPAIVVQLYETVIRMYETVIRMLETAKQSREAAIYLP